MDGGRTEMKEDARWGSLGPWRNLCANDQYKQSLTQGKRPGLDRSLRGGFVVRRL